jgi:phage baseplate assembly protein W
MLTKKVYSDIDLKFLPQPVSKDVSFSYDGQAIVRSIKNLLLTKPYERLFQPDLGSEIDALLFEPISPLTASLLQDEITRTIDNWEPRARIATVEVSAYPDQNAYEVSLFFYILNQTEPTGVNLILQRSR